MNAGTALADAVRAQLALLTAEWHVRRRSTGSLVSLVGDGALHAAECQASGEAGSVAVAEGAGEAPGHVPRVAYREAAAIHRAARYGLFRPRCLTRAIALERLLVKRGLSPTVRIGVRRASGTLEAHAWVELQGAVLGDHRANVSGFSPLAGFVSR